MQPLQLPPSPPAIVAPAKVVELPFESLGSLIVVSAKVNGKPARLILDTCAGVSLITPEAAKKFELGTGMPIAIGGAGEISRRAELVQLRSLECAGRSEVGQPAVILSLPASGGKSADGILGMPFLSRYVLRIDYAAKKVSFLSPGSPAPKGASPLPLTRRMGLPETELSVDGLTGKVRVDTGYGGTFSFTSPTVTKEKLREKYTRRIETITGQGLGGHSVGEAVRTGTLTLGEHSLKDAVAFLSADKSGALADSGTVGLLGGEALSRFTVTFDFPAGKLYLEKNAHFGEPFVGPRAGFSGTLEVDGTYLVRTVTPGSPAQQAGIQIGDRIIAIGGTPVRTLGYNGVRESLRSTVTSQLALRLLDKEGAAREVVVTLRELL
jgi:hypothetical protein